MKHAIASLLAMALAAGCTGYAYINDLPRSHRAAIVTSDSACDDAGVREHSDPSSNCYIDRRRKPSD